MLLKNKAILIISPQAWGEMFISKHHYALTLAKMGNKVYFLNPPETGNIKKAGQILISTSCTHHNLLLIKHSLKFPFLLKFHATRVFHWLMGFHIQGILKKISHPLDIIWSFDQGNLYPFKFFGKKPFKIFQPVDEPMNMQAIKAAEGSHVILSVTNDILEKYSAFEQPKHLINHGTGEDFLLPALTARHNKNIHVGLSGNLLRPDIDWDIFLKIVDQNPAIVFECWGSYSSVNNNIGGAEDQATKLFIRLLQQKGVILHGPASSVNLARELHRMDAFLICYDVKKDQSKGTNYHKIMEYLSTGKVIIASNVSAYQVKPELIEMVKERDSNELLPLLFKKIINDLGNYNTPELQLQRKKYAGANTYVNQVGRIQQIIHEEFGRSLIK